MLVKKVSFNLMVFALVVSFSLFLNACAKKVAVEEIEQKEEVIATEEVSDEAAEQKRLEEERAAREAQLKEEALRKEREREEAARREEEARREEAAKREAQLREEFEKENIHFDFDKFFLSDEAKETLSKKASWLLDNPDINITIEGHCDERGTNEYNMALGERRANSAMKYFVNAGVNAGRISLISYGEEKPLDPESNETAWAKNRRDQFRIISE
ncbi:MAG: peptidoglycan-associated lipoprotein Pal [Thermodesulfobacteriota bacterium]|nr:peptidoglycan-associated lipoprotein Pal [Thermodesulfobacteriota bacterium]